MMRSIRNIIFSDNKQNTTPKPDLILHIGTEKTGTTTIHEFLRLNRNLLASQGICCPSFMQPRNHRQLAVFCCNNNRSNQYTLIKGIDDRSKRKKWKINFRALFDEKMQKITCRYDSIIISSEHLSTLLRNKHEIRYLKRFLKKYASSFTIIIYIRRQDLIAGSIISNIAKVGFGTSLPKGDEIYKRHFYNYERLLKKWSSIFGKENIRLRIFEKSHLINGDLIQDFMKQACVNNDIKFKILGRLNTSLSVTAVEVAWLFNKKFPLDNNKFGIKKLRDLRMELVKNVNQKYPGQRKMITKHDAIKFLHEFEKYNRKLASSWFGRKQLFSEDFSMYPDTEPKADPELVRQLVEDFIKQKGLSPIDE